MAENTESKIYNASLVSYAPTSFIESILKDHISQLKAYSYCYHDKDKDKKPHTHILICSNMPLKLSTFINWFKFINENGEKENTLGEKCISAKAQFNYLCHLDDPDKYQYPISDRVTYNEDYFTVSNNDDLSVLALNDLLCGLTLRECALKYGKAFIYHYGHFRQLLADISEQEGKNFFSNKKN